MSEDLDDDIAAPEPAGHRRRSPGLAGIAVLVAIIALAVAAWGMWRQQRALQASQAAQQQDSATIASLQSRLAAGDEQTQAGNRRIEKLETALDDLRSTTQGFDRRLANLETAYANLSGQQQSGRDTLLLNDAEMLLRSAQQRYQLFHDSTGALKAYSQAIQVLAQVQNPAYAPVRASAMTERDALAAAAPPSRQAALDTLSTLRGKVAALPLANHGTSTATPARPGFWSRLGRAFGSIVKVTREQGHPGPLVDPRFARQTLALDLAQAQEAMLAFDNATGHAALQRAEATLTAQFDDSDAGVQAAISQLQDLLAQHAAGPTPQLGGALAQLQSLRASQAPPVTPAPASTSAARQP